jgi:glycogen debranching enzyme
MAACCNAARHPDAACATATDRPWRHEGDRVEALVDTGFGRELVPDLDDPGRMPPTRGAGNGVILGAFPGRPPRIRAVDRPEVVIHADLTVLRSAWDGSIELPEHGLFDADARLLCRHRLTIDGRSPEFVASTIVDDERWLGAAIVPWSGGSPDGPSLPQDAIGVLVERQVGPGMTERIEVANHGGTAISTTLRVELAADLVDLLDLGRGGVEPRPVPGSWDEASAHLSFIRSETGPAGEILRTSRVGVRTADRPVWDGAALAFRLELEPSATWQADLAVDAGSAAGWRGIAVSRAADKTGRPGTGPADPERRAAERAAWRSGRTQVRSEPPLFGRIVDRAIEDLFALRARDLERGDGRWVLNAGVPQFTGLFGRDVLTAGWQAALAGPEPLLGALDAIAETQADRDDPFRDAEPGKLVHEMRRGPRVEAGLSPRDAYYGSQTVPAMFVLALSEAWHWTGDDELLRRHIDVAERATRWAEGQASESGHGFLTYRTRSPEGLRNQGWKDSDEAIRYPDGRIVPVPIATLEEQAFHALALERLAEIHTILGKAAEAKQELHRAADHRRRWHDAFWREELGFYAMALDPEGRPVDSIASNAGHALGTGAIPRALAGRVAERLLEPDLFSGFGVRTLSADHPSYNPFAYHLGSVWPVENATFILGGKRYGLDAVVERLVEGMTAAAAGSPAERLPEALAGLSRSEWPVPVPYPAANSPQAWSASAMVQAAQALIGLYPFAPIGVAALVRPRLPDWLDVLEIERLRVGKATISLRFERRPDGSASHEVTHQDGRLVVLEAHPPQALDGGPLETTAAWLLEHAPGSMARAVRIALGIETERLVDDRPADRAEVTS